MLTTLGNHDFFGGHGRPYFSYFGASAGPAGLGYYATTLGAWQIISLNTEIAAGPGSAQFEWLKAQLAASPAACTLAMWHRPLFTSGPNDHAAYMRDIWRLLIQHGAELVLSGHNHQYERFALQDADGRPDPRGMRQFVVGTGGYPLYGRDALGGQQRGVPQRRVGRAEAHAEERVVRVGVHPGRRPQFPRLRHRRLRHPLIHARARGPARGAHAMLQITPAFAIGENELDERFVRASGPGGQNVNKVATAVELRFDVPASSLPGEVKARLAALAGKRMNADGVILIDSREHRTQAANREAARARLVRLLQQAFRKPRSRKATRPTKASRERRLDAKGQRAQVKSGRGRLRGEDT